MAVARRRGRCRGQAPPRLVGVIPTLDQMRSLTPDDDIAQGTNETRFTGVGRPMRGVQAEAAIESEKSQVIAFSHAFNYSSAGLPPPDRAQLPSASPTHTRSQMMANDSQTPVLDAVTEMNLAPLANLKGTRRRVGDARALCRSRSTRRPAALISRPSRSRWRGRSRARKGRGGASRPRSARRVGADRVGRDQDGPSGGSCRTRGRGRGREQRRLGPSRDTASETSASLMAAARPGASHEPRGPAPSQTMTLTQGIDRVGAESPPIQRAIETRQVGHVVRRRRATIIRSE